MRSIHDPCYHVQPIDADRIFSLMKSLINLKHNNFLFVGYLFLLVACSSEELVENKKDSTIAEQSISQSADQVLRKGNGAEPQTLDPHKAEGVPSANILRDLYEGLITEAPDGSLVPGAAKQWDLSPSGTVYTFQLREEAKWSNGEPLTARDFVYGFRRSVDPATGSKYSQILSSILNAEDIIKGVKPVETLGVKALSRHRLEITLKAPTPYFLGLLTHSTTYPVYRPAVEKYGGKFARPGNLVSNGAYRLDQWIVQSHVTLERNPDYWNDSKTTIEKVTYYVIEDQSSELRRYRAGEIDWTETIPLGETAWIHQNLADELKVSPYLGTYYYGFNLTKPPFKDNRALRAALSMAIDREIITEKISGLGEIPAYGWVPPGVMNYTSQRFDFKSMERRQRLAEAKRLYRKAGYSENNPLHIELRYNTSENHRKVAITVAAMWKKALGLRTELVNEEWKVFLKNRKQKQVTQVFRAGWIGDYNDAYTFAELMYSSHGINDVGYQNPHYDRLLAKASLEKQPEKRRLLLEEAERVLLSDHPIIPIYFYVSKSLVKPYVGGFVGNVMDHHYTKHFQILNH